MTHVRASGECHFLKLALSKRQRRIHDNGNHVTGGAFDLIGDVGQASLDINIRVGTTEKSATKGAITSQGLGLFRVTRFVIGLFFNGWLA